MDRGCPVSAASRCGPSLRSWRSRQILASALAGSRRGLRHGREERSQSPFPRSSSHLRSHRYTVSLDTPAASAVAATVHPSRSTRWTKSHLPYSVS